MRYFALILSVGVASAVSFPTLVNTNASSIFGSSQSASSATAGVNGGLNLGDLNLGGLNLGSVNLGNQNDVANAIELMLGALCLSNVIDANSIIGLGNSADIEMFLELAQLMELEQSGLISLNEMQTMFSNSLFNSFNLGVFKRALADKKKVRRQNSQALKPSS